MNNKQQTAVEYLEKTVNAMIKNGGDSDLLAVLWHVQQAKEMEKEKAIKLHYEYELYVMMNESVVMTFGQFYEQTYGGGER